jgi:hypothetical protein
MGSIHRELSYWIIKVLREACEITNLLIFYICYHGDITETHNNASLLFVLLVVVVFYFTLTLQITISSYSTSIKCVTKVSIFSIFWKYFLNFGSFFPWFSHDSLYLYDQKIVEISLVNDCALRRARGGKIFSLMMVFTIIRLMEIFCTPLMTFPIFSKYFCRLYNHMTVRSSGPRFCKHLWPVIETLPFKRVNVGALVPSQLNYN